MKIHVVVLQDGSNYYFDVEGERVPEVHELFVERNAVYSVVRVMTYRKNNKIVPVVVVKRGESDHDMERLMNDLDAKVRD